MTSAVVGVYYRILSSGRCAVTRHVLPRDLMFTHAKFEKNRQSKGNLCYN